MYNTLRVATGDVGVLNVVIDAPPMNLVGADHLRTFGIPLTAIFIPGKKDPVVLASIYSSKELLDTVNEALGPNTAQAAAR